MCLTKVLLWPAFGWRVFFNLWAGKRRHTNFHSMTDRILLVEDDRELGAQIVGHLERAGFSAVWWTEGQRIVRGSMPTDIALVILDLMLPGADGMDMLKELRESSE